MSFESEADRLSLLQNLGETVRVGGTDVVGVFGNDYLGIPTPASEIPSSDSYLWLTSTQVADLPVTVGSAVEFGGQSWTVAILEPDGTGMTRLTLERRTS